MHSDRHIPGLVDTVPLDIAEPNVDPRIASPISAFDSRVVHWLVMGFVSVSLSLIVILWVLR